MTHPFVEQAQVLEDAAKHAAKHADRWTEPEQIRAMRLEARRLRQWARDDDAWYEQQGPEDPIR